MITVTNISRIIIFDFEVFKHDCLLGAIILEENKDPELFQTWDLNKIKEFYFNNINSVWIGHNNEYYDNFILEAIVRGKDPKIVNDDIIGNHNKRRYLNLKLYYYDLMKFHMGSLKVLEAFMGKNISETEVDFDLDRKLTDEERSLTESYNQDDLNQTLEDFNYLKDEFMLRLDIINEFNLPLNYLCTTQARIAAKVLGATFNDNLKNLPVYPKMYDSLRVNDQRVIDFYMKREYSTGSELLLDFGGTPHYMKAGGIHGAIENCHFDKVCYLDVSGYYNLVMINFDLLPRSVPESGRKLYEYMYHEQLRLKKINPVKRQVYKIILLSVFGAMNNEYCEFCDPWHGDLVRMTGQMFLVDLLEKLTPVAKIVQSNTDGIMCVPLEGHTENEIKAITDEWQNRTGFVLKFDFIYNLYQRDVNNYIYQDEKGEIHTKGEAVKYYGGYDDPYSTSSYMSKEPLIISKCIVEYCINDKLPEQVIEENKQNLKLFQSICKKGTFEWLEYQEDDLVSGEIKITKLQHVNRAFAYNSIIKKGMVYKRRSSGKTTKTKISGLPSNVFIFNEDLSKFTEKDRSNIDYQYYINRAYERIWDFVGQVNE